MVVGWACSRKDFRDSMVSNYKKSPLTIGWANKYSPILDVTDRVRVVFPEVKEARLTIWGDKLDQMMIIGPFIDVVETPWGHFSVPLPELPDEEIVINWINGYEWERQTCSKDGYKYFVGYPCTLEVDGKVVTRTAEGFDWKWLALIGGAALGLMLAGGRKK